MKKTPLEEYENVRKTGLAAIALRDDDELIEVKTTDNEKEIILVTKFGQCIRFKENDVRTTGRVSMGVRGINLLDGDEVVGMQICTQGDYLLVVSENGMGKRTPMAEFTVQLRGGKGVKCYKITEKTGNLIGSKAVNEDNEIMMITTEGIIIRTPCSGISVMGRITSGVKLMDVDGEIKVASIAKVRDKEASEETSVSEKENETASEKRRNNTASKTCLREKAQARFSRLGKGRKYETNFTDGAAESASGSVDVVPALLPCSASGQVQSGRAL